MDFSIFLAFLKTERAADLAAACFELKIFRGLPDQLSVLGGLDIVAVRYDYSCGHLLV